MQTAIMQSSSPAFHFPSTPSRSSYYSARSHQPMNSSPLASPKSSPTTAAQARRRSQYKSTASRIPSTSRGSNTERIGQPLFYRTGSQVPEDPQKSFLRERFKARCFERAQKQRESAVASRRRDSEPGDLFSDTSMDCEEEEDENSVMQDELFRRIVSNAKHKIRHSYRLSYSNEVGSSFDPDMEDVSGWESELRDHTSSTLDMTPEDLEAEEIAAYAEEYAALEDFADIDVTADDFSVWSDAEDLLPEPLPRKGKAQIEASDEDMDMT
ncbi:hypothetical protein BV22DRAFT_1034633 [Leucogyrophana mollusca]|uniref:Uncharacterized protein n=1 Tax=Leucogyrophana mollusca TaxID=85980 RepID=A0ACB8BK60_9AGAM|nr:hypothetical protein BV22DRAFT_1034633 [Leucogyrophana mollusca]